MISFRHLNHGAILCLIAGSCLSTLSAQERPSRIAPKIVCVDCVRVTIVSGNGQTGNPSDTLSQPLVIRLTAVFDGAPVPDARVDFEVTPPSGATGTMLSSPTGLPSGSPTFVAVITDAQGIGLAQLKLGNLPGDYPVAVSCGGCIGAKFTETAIEAAPCSVGALMTTHSDDPHDRVHLTPSLIVALGNMELLVPSVGGSFAFSSGFRTQAYQEHLREVWFKWMDPLEGLKDNDAPECQKFKEEIHSEFGRRDAQGKCVSGHCLLETQPPALRSDHTGGTVTCPGPLACAFDASVDPGPIYTIDALADSCGLTRPRPRRDRVHFRLKA